MEEVKDIITREYNPHKNARIMRIIGDLYYLRTKLPMLQNEAGNRYIQDIIKYKTKSNKAYEKAGQSRELTNRYKLIIHPCQPSCQCITRKFGLASKI